MNDDEHRAHGHDHRRRDHHQPHAHDDEHVYGTAYFDEAAETWDDDPAKVERAEAIADRIAAEVPLSRDDRVMDYGADTGLLGRALADRVGPVTLADASAGMTEVNQRRIGDQPGQISALRLDLATDPVPQGRYDLVVSLQALHHVTDVPRVLAALREICHGWVAIADLDAEDGSFHGEGFHGPHGFGRDEMAAALREAGFGDVRVVDGTTMTKEVDGEQREFGLFLALGRAG